MVDFKFYKTLDQWQLNIFEEDIVLSTIYFDDSVNDKDIVKIASILGKSNLLNITINHEKE